MTRKNRGRPADPGLQEGRKTALINAASTLLKTKSYRNITIRELAEYAGMQSAMVSYYFGSKEGLFVAMFEALATQQLEKLQQLLANDNPLQSFVRIILQTLSEAPHITRLLVDEVLTHESELQRQFIDIFPRRMARILPTVLKAQQDRGLLRKDLDPHWCAFSLMTMIITPFVAKPVREIAWNIPDQTLATDAWADHIYRLFMHGVAGVTP